MKATRSNSIDRMSSNELGFIAPDLAANIASGVASIFQAANAPAALSGSQFDRRAERTDGRLGLDPVTLAATATSLINASQGIMGLFGGGGGRQAAMKALEGKQYGQFPPGTSFDKYLDDTMVWRGNERTHRYIYSKKAGSSWMRRNGVGSERDYGALIALNMIRDGHCDPNVRDPNKRAYQNCPVFASNGINIFDTERLRAYYERDQLEAQRAQLNQRAEEVQREIAVASNATRPERLALIDNALATFSCNIGGQYRYGGSLDRVSAVRTQQQSQDCEVYRQQLIAEKQSLIANAAAAEQGQQELNSIAQQIQQINDAIALGTVPPSSIANVPPTAYYWGAELDAEDVVSPAPAPIVTSAAPPPAQSGMPSWLLPAIAVGGVLLISQQGKK